MIPFMKAASLSVLACCAVFAQTTPSFEVASIKPADPQPQGMIRVGMGGDAGRVTYSNVTLKNVLTRAYGVKPHQISGPDWLDSQRFDITAKLPEGATKEQIPAMLQNLLAERFKMTIHKESREQPVYALVVGKNGPKLTKAGENSDFSRLIVGPNGERIQAPPPPSPAPGGAAGGGAAAGTRPGGMMMMMTNGHVEARRATIPGFCDMLSNFLDRPVINNTDIEGEYDITLDVAPEEMAGMRGGIAVGARVPLAGPGGPAAGPGVAHSPEGSPAPESSGASIFASVQQLGLKLEPRKSPMDFIVIDRAEKVPTEN
jgi:uncharacterized protein (TIGR03435 family)